MENWKAIEGYEGLYEISATGLVKGLRRGKLLKTHRNNSGYLRVHLSKGGDDKHFLVHRLVAKAFCDGYADGLVVNHIDSDKLNNKACNLEWLTCKDSTLDVKRRGAFDTSSGVRAAQLKNSRPVEMLDPRTDLPLGRFNSMAEVKSKMGINSGSISAVCLGKNKTAGGYKWRYAK